MSVTPVTHAMSATSVTHEPVPADDSTGANSAQYKTAGGIEYLAQGTAQDPHSPPIICLHGIGGNSSSFAPQLAALSRYHRIISWTMPGYGHSTPLATVDFSTLSQALADFMHALKIKRAHLIGHSIGGMIAQELALTQPERVQSLALLATTSAFGGRDDRFKDNFLAARLKPLDEGKSMAELAQQFVPALVGADTDAPTLNAAIAGMRNIPTQSYRAILACLVTFNRYQDIAQLNMPVCLLAGAEDNTAPPATMQKMAERIPDAEFHTLAGTGHLLNLEAAEACNQILLKFFDRQ